MKAGDRLLLALDSWGGRSYNPVRVEKVCPKRVKVTWLGVNALGRRYGESYYVPKEALRPWAMK